MAFIQSRAKANTIGLLGSRNTTRLIAQELSQSACLRNTSFGPWPAVIFRHLSP